MKLLKPQNELLELELRGLSLKYKTRISPDEMRELRAACLMHEGTDIALLVMRWENFKNIRPVDILEIGKVFRMEMNKCGPDGWKGALVPERPPTLLWLVSFASACNLHDVLYGIGGDWIDKLFADLYFRRKMLDACRRKLLFTWMLGLRWGERTAEIYYYFVSRFGDPYFKWNKKEVAP